MKIFNALITSYDNGCDETSVKSFLNLDTAMEYLHNEYLEIKSGSGEDGDFDIEDVINHGKDKTENFYMEIFDSHWWCCGVIYDCDVE